MISLDKAVQLMTTAHALQYRKGIHDNVPYQQHPWDVHKRVVHYLLTAKADNLQVDDAYMQAAALMHDLLEDTRVLADDIRETFDEQVVTLIKELTRDKEDGNGPAARYDYLARFFEKSLAAVVIKIADRYCNVLDFQADPDKRVYASWYALQAFPVFQAYLTHGGSNPRIIDDIHQLNAIVQYRYPTLSLFDRTCAGKVEHICRRNP
jgi:(p)ppGpp synthase/HD superfamily hydrolase